MKLLSQFCETLDRREALLGPTTTPEALIAPLKAEVPSFFFRVSVTVVSCTLVFRRKVPARSSPS